jgi:hypothetical protein
MSDLDGQQREALAPEQEKAMGEAWVKHWSGMTTVSWHGHRDDFEAGYRAALAAAEQSHVERMAPVVEALADVRISCPTCGADTGHYDLRGQLEAALTVREEPTEDHVWTLLIGPGGIGVLPGEYPGYEGVERVVVVPKVAREEATVPVELQRRFLNDAEFHAEVELVRRRLLADGSAVTTEAVILVVNALLAAREANYSLGRLRGRLDATLRKHGRLTEGDSRGQ